LKNKILPSVKNNLKNIPISNISLVEFK